MRISGVNLKWLKPLLVVLSIIVGLVLFVLSNYGCKTQKSTSESEEQKPEPQAVKPLPAIPWLLDNDIYIEAGDPIMFYNQYHIVVQGKVPIKIKSYHNGKFSTKDSSINFDYSVPAGTKGKLIKVEHSRGKPASFIVRFNHLLQTENQGLGDQDTTAYDHVFPLQPNKEFSISLNPKIIKIAGEDRSVDLGLYGDGSKKCRIMYYPENSNSESTIGAPASGVPDIIGTKIIKKN